MFADSTKVASLTCCCGILGQILARIWYLGGTLHRPELLGGFVFPISLWPTWVLWDDDIPKGESKDFPKGTDQFAVVDDYIYIFPLLTISMAIIFKIICRRLQNATLRKISQCSIGKTHAEFIITYINIICFALIRHIKNMDLCGEKARFGTAIIEACMAIIGGVIFTISLTIASKIPYVGLFFKAFNKALGIIPGSRTGVLLSLAHIIFNMRQNTQSMKDSICEDDVNLFSKKICSWMCATCCTVCICGMSLSKVK